MPIAADYSGSEPPVVGVAGLPSRRPLLVVGLDAGDEALYRGQPDEQVYHAQYDGHRREPPCPEEVAHHAEPDPHNRGGYVRAHAQKRGDDATRTQQNPDQAGEPTHQQSHPLLAFLALAGVLPRLSPFHLSFSTRSKPRASSAARQLGAWRSLAQVHGTLDLVADDVVHSVGRNEEHPVATHVHH